MTAPLQQPWACPIEPYALPDYVVDAIDQDFCRDHRNSNEFSFLTDSLSPGTISDISPSISNPDWSSFLDLDQFDYVDVSEHPSSSSTSSPELNPIQRVTSHPTSEPYTHTPLPPIAMTPPRSISPIESVGSAPEPPRKRVSQRTAHNRIEKRYRENLSNNFTALEQALHSYERRSTRGPSRRQASRKMAILTDAVQYIEELQEEAATLRMKMKSLRQTLLPHGIWKYTMND
ncbi:hypothetical protein ATEIFO6365_0009023600 [Aspergillus terreus]|uniref:Uncharacterized protein n=1 Tax=Aspergillus terreus TaxID=33178 RepID=A0A5M3Z7P8_ASPTE|nr:hypothetical protein ATETN484_0011023600 [Aspergillus terreus]GFF18873.1 hypothetical protein ATEIFO6365_0009023600 [Aspergillus terreus]